MWLAIEGVIGAGKTTTAELLGRETSLVPMIERSDQHPFLDAYYQDPSRYAFETELVFMALQAHQVGAIDAPGEFVSDFAPAKNFVFARATCSPDDLDLLETVDIRLWRDLPTPDLTVVLDVPVEVCLRRISERGRRYEQGLSMVDLERIRDGYAAALSGLGDEVKVLSFSGSEAPTEVASRVAAAANLGPFEGSGGLG